MKKSIQSFIGKLKENADGTISGGFGSIRGGTSAFFMDGQTNSGTCSGTNSGCSNTGKCDGSTNNKAGSTGCSNTGSCL